MVILGIDPGIASTGFGVISSDGGSLSFLRCGYIKTKAGSPIAGRLNQIHSDMNRLLKEIDPDLIAIENIFSAVKYPRAGIMLGGVLGALYISAHKGRVPTIEISPREVRSCLIGWGGAGKAQVKSAVKRLLGLKGIKSLHASDALAVAIAAYYRGRM